MQKMLKAAGAEGKSVENGKREEAEEESEEELLQRAIALSLECHNLPDQHQAEEMASQKLPGVIWYWRNYMHLF